MNKVEESPKVRQLSFAVQYRLRFIDFLLAQYGTIRRAALMNYFGISMVQASLDLRYYQELAPSNIKYDKTAKLYRTTEQFKRLWL